MKNLKEGSKRIKISDFKLYEKKKLFWKRISDISITQGEILELFAKNNNLALVMEDKIKNFVKGYIDHEGNISGARIKHLPNGKKLARGGYSIFAKHLTYNQNEEFSWDICYQNSSGTKTYLYSEDKVHLEEEKKYKLVKKFEKNYNKIMRNLKEDIIKKTNPKNKISHLEYLALYTLIKTKIRVGNYEYYKTLGHKGLTTLQKKDITITSDNYIRFNFIGKDGIPQDIIVKFEPWFINKLKERLDLIKDNDFVFTNSLNHPLHSSIFSKILFEYTNEHFYPHIIRSYYADKEVEKEIKNLNDKSKKKTRKKITKEDIEKIYLKIAKNLGHKKFNKKTNSYDISYRVTLNNYIYPKLQKKLESFIEKKH